MNVSPLKLMALFRTRVWKLGCNCLSSHPCEKRLKANSIFRERCMMTQYYFHLIYPPIICEKRTAIRKNNLTRDLLLTILHMLAQIHFWLRQDPQERGSGISVRPCVCLSVTLCILEKREHEREHWREITWQRALEREHLRESTGE